MENEALKGALKKVEAQQDNFGFMDRFSVPEHWAVKNAIEKQIAKKWIRTEEFDGECTWGCPNCKEVFFLIYGDVSDNKYNYCPNCGQKLNWNWGDAE